jgi:hypothetical protein
VNAISQRVCHVAPNPCRTVIRDLRARFSSRHVNANVSLRKRFSTDKKRCVLDRTDASKCLKDVTNQAEMPVAKGIKVRSTDPGSAQKGNFCLSTNV